MPQRRAGQSEAEGFRKAEKWTLASEYAGVNYPLKAMSGRSLFFYQGRTTGTPPFSPAASCPPSPSYPYGPLVQRHRRPGRPRPGRCCCAWPPQTVALFSHVCNPPPHPHAYVPRSRCTGTVCGMCRVSDVTAVPLCVGARSPILSTTSRAINSHKEKTKKTALIVSKPAKVKSNTINPRSPLRTHASRSTFMTNHQRER